MTVAEESFQKKLIHIEEDIARLVHNYGYFKDYFECCLKAAKQSKEDSPVLSSEYYFLSSVACFSYLLENGLDDKILSYGKTTINAACSIIQDDREYNLYKLFYTAFDVVGATPESAFEILKSLKDECPSFSLLKDNLIRKEWSEDRFYQLLNQYLPSVVDGLINEGLVSQCKEACQIMIALPGVLSKLKAYTYLSRLYFNENNYVEALRCAKLGIELLGSDINYDYKDEKSMLWGECWTRVAECSRRKCEYDFAMSLFEKGSSLGIVDCIRLLGEMYERGESEDIDLSKANELYERARNLQTQREKEIQDEKDRIKREEAKRLEKIRREKQDRELEEKIAKIKAANRIKRNIAIITIVIFASSIVACIGFLTTGSILDKLYKYETEGKAILAYSDSKDMPCVVFMDKKNIYVDNIHTVNAVLTVGSANTAYHVKVFPTSNGGKATKAFSSKSLIITSSKKCFVSLLSDMPAFIISTERMTEFADGEHINDCYIVSYDGKNRTVSYIRDGICNQNSIQVECSGDFADYLKDLYPRHFSNSEMSYIKQYSQYQCNANLLIGYDGTQTAGLYGDVSFPELLRKTPSSSFGEKENIEWFISDISTLASGGLTSPMISRIFNSIGELQYRRSNDGKKTFVIKKDAKDQNNAFGLYVVENETKQYRCLDHGEEIEFLSSCIRIKQNGSFLLFFSKTDNIYYDYNGRRYQ